MLTGYLSVSFVLTFILVTFYGFPYSAMSHNAKIAHVALVAPSARIKINSQIADANTVSGTQTVEIESFCGVPNWSVAQYQTRYAGTLNAQWFRAMFSNSANLCMFDRRNVRRNTDYGAWAR